MASTIETTSEPLWYVAHTYSGYENKVKESLEKIIENRKLEHLILDVQIPVETVVEGEGDKQKEVESKLFPSYVMVKMIMSDETWHVVRNITGVTGFVGPGFKPTPLTDDEVRAMGVEVDGTQSAAAPERKLSFAVGDIVTLNAGFLQGNTGTVTEISPDQQKVTVTVSMFGRDTSVELDVANVKKQ